MTPPLWLSLASLVAILLGCEARPRPKLPDTRPALARLEAQVARLDPLAYAVPAARACAEACAFYGPKRITFRPGEALCECNRLPTLKRHPLPPPERPRPAVARAE